VLDFLRRAAATARYLVGICTGSLVLGAAGLLRGRRAGTHWVSRDLLRTFGAEPVSERVIVEGNIFTGGGITTGIDVALAIPPKSPAGRSRRRSRSVSNTSLRRLSRAAHPRRPPQPCWPACWLTPSCDRAEWVAHAAAALG
jgi:transcriptional regulator GlxA family with amidase domain